MRVHRMCALHGSGERGRRIVGAFPSAVASTRRVAMSLPRSELPERTRRVSTQTSESAVPLRGWHATCPYPDRS